MAKKRTPVLLFNVSEEDKKAYKLVMTSGMPCELLATEDDKTPVLISRGQEFRGLKEIEEYVESWKNWKKRQIKIRFYSNDTEEAREILQLLMEAEIPYINLGPVSELQTPSIKYGHWEYYGLKATKDFIENNWKTGNLPPLD